MGAFFMLEKEDGDMAKGKYHKWITEEGLTKLEGWAMDGLSDEQIATNMGINKATLYRWKDKYCNICDSLKRGKEVIDRQVENALLKRALGYNFEEVTHEPEYLIDPITGNRKRVMQPTKVVTKQVAPDTTAQIFWLKNRKPTEWRDKKETEISGGLKVDNPFEGLTIDELRKLARSQKHE